MNAQISPAVRREQPHILRLVLPRCPNCGSSRLLADKTIAIDDETKIRRAHCDDCGERVHIEVSYAKKETVQNLAHENCDLGTFPTDAS